MLIIVFAFFDSVFKIWNSKFISFIWQKYFYQEIWMQMNAYQRLYIFFILMECTDIVLFLYSKGYFTKLSKVSIYHVSFKVISCIRIFIISMVKILPIRRKTQSNQSIEI